jgi:glycosyltransferase involved in cell wall biosynthesis
MQLNHKPLVSVITPSFNQGSFIEKTIQSVLSQDYNKIEYLVIDGGSQDNTLEILDRYEGKLWWVSEPDEGQSDAINKGFKKAKGDIVCWLNSDDTYQPGAISKAVEFFESHPDVMMIYGEGNEIDEQGFFLHRFPHTRKFDLWALIYICDYILQPTVFIRKDVFGIIDLPNKDLHWCMDWDLWIRVGSRFKVVYVDYVFANSRIYAETKTASGGIKRFKEITFILRKYGKRKYPLGYFIYAVDTLESISTKIHPLLSLLLRILLSISRKLLKRLKYSYQGVYTDNWLGKRAYFMLPIQLNLKFITFELELPYNQKKLPNKLEVRLYDGDNTTILLPGPGKYTINIPLKSGIEQNKEVELYFNKSFKLNCDYRKLSCLKVE